MRTIVLIVLLILPASIVFAEMQTDPFGFSEDDYSSWGIIDAPYPYTGMDAEGNEIGYGCFPVGNGLVFAHLGVDGDFNTLRGVTGPGYQPRDDEGKAVYWQEGEWPEMRVSLGYAPILISAINCWDKAAFTTQSVQQVRGAAIVRTVQRSEKHGVLYSLTYAVPGHPIVMREFIWVPAKRLKHCVEYNVCSTIHLELPAAELIWPGQVGSEEEHTSYALLTQDQFRWLLVPASGELRELGSFLAQGPLLGKENEVMLRGKTGTWNGRLVACFSLALIFYSEEDGLPDFDVAAMFYPVKGALGAYGRGFIDPTVTPSIDEYQPEYRRLTRDYWQAWSSQNMSFDTGDTRLDDMMTQLLADYEAAGGTVIDADAGAVDLSQD